MAYRLDSVTIRTNNTKEGIQKIQDLWRDIANGTLPILFDSEKNIQKGISPVSKYDNYEANEVGDYDLSVLGVTVDFFQNIEQEVIKGSYKKYDVSDEDGNLIACAQKAWNQVWEEQKSMKIKRAFTADYESSVPAEYTKDGKAHCYLYIAVC